MRWAVLMVLAAAPAMAQLQAVNAASQLPADSPATGVAAGSLCIVNASRLYGPPFLSPVGEKLTLRFRAKGSLSARDLAVVVLSSSSYEFTVLIPVDAAVGESEIVGVTAGGRESAAKVWIVASGFGIFTRGFNTAAAQIVRDRVENTGLTNPVRPSDWVTLWGTGLGSGIPIVDIAGIDVAPAYAGPAPGLQGVDQINFQFPAGVPDDCYIPLSVKVSGRASQVVSIPAASAPGPCRHRMGLSSEALAALDRNLTIPVSQIWIRSQVIPDFTQAGLYLHSDTATIDFLQVDAATVETYTGLLIPKTEWCGIGTVRPGIIGVLAIPMDAGQPVLSGPGVRIPMEGAIAQYPPLSTATYPLDKVPPSMFLPGIWSVSSQGGRDVGAFQVDLRLPPPLAWTNRATLGPVSRAKDLVLTWDPAGYGESEWMFGSIAIGAEYVECGAPASAGKVTIPASLLAQLSAGSRARVQLVLTPRGDPVLYSLPRTNGGALFGTAQFGHLEMVTVDLR